MDEDRFVVTDSHHPHHPAVLNCFDVVKKIYSHSRNASIPGYRNRYLLIFNWEFKFCPGVRLFRP